MLDLVLLASDLCELTADPDTSATGFVLESTQDPRRGASATLIIKDGTLIPHDFVVAGDAYAPIRFIEDFLGKRVLQAGPSEPVRISGFTTLPTAGSLFSIAKNKKEAEVCVAENAKTRASAPERSELAEGVIEMPLILKADVTGSIDAITHELAKIEHDRAVVRIIASGVGNVSENDVKTAIASGGTIIAFNTGTDAIARDLAERDHVTILSFSIIYELAEKVMALLEERAPAIISEKELGRAKVLKAFSGNAKKHVLGARYISGTLTLGDRLKLIRGDEEIARGSITNLQQARIDTKDIRTEGDFGIEIEVRETPVYGDEIIAFIAPKS